MECVIYVKIFERYHDAIYIIERIKLEDLCSGGEENAMPELKINIRTEILDWIIENASFDEFRHEFKEDIALWKSGAKSPTFNQLERFSKSTNIPFGYFFWCYSTYKDLILSNLYTWSRFKDLTITFVYDPIVSFDFARKTINFS